MKRDISSYIFVNVDFGGGGGFQPMHLYYQVSGKVRESKITLLRRVSEKTHSRGSLITWVMEVNVFFLMLSFHRLMLLTWEKRPKC